MLAVSLGSYVYIRVLIIVKNSSLCESPTFFQFLRLLHSLVSCKKRKDQDFDLKYINIGVENIGGKIKILWRYFVGRMSGNRRG